MPRPTAFALSLAAAVTLAALPAAAPAAGYGDLKGKVVLDGEAPELAPRIEEGAEKTKDGQPVKDPAVCAADPVPDFSLVVGEGGGIANVFLFPLRPPRDVKPDLKNPPEQAVVFDQEGCVFKPHALLVRAGQPLKLISSDPVAHNVRFTPFVNRGQGLNKTIPANLKEGVVVTFDKGERFPLPALCDFHPWMKANWLIVDHPYAAVTGPDGTFTIEGLPAGKHKFVVWHESAGMLDRGLDVEIKADEATDLGELTYEKADFKDLK